MSWVREAGRQRSGTFSVLGWMWVGIVILFSLGPLFIVVPVSFTSGGLAAFPPIGFSLRWYQAFFADFFWVNALKTSLKLAVTVGILSTIIGFLLALATSRVLSRSTRKIMRIVLLLPFIIPTIVSAIAIFSFFSRLGLVGTFPGMVIAHTIMALPFAVLVIESGLMQIDPSLEEAARSLGASRLQRMAYVLVPLLLPALTGCFVFSFVFSFDEVIVALFVGGASYQTLPAKMYVFLETELRPTPAVVSVLLIVTLVVARIAAQLVLSLQRWRRVSPVNKV